MLAIEIDGNSYDFEQVIINDENRQKKLESMGVNFLRFEDKEVKQDIENVVCNIKNWIYEHSKH